LLRSLYRAISRRSYDELGAREPCLGLVRHLWRTKELRARQSLHDPPPKWSARGFADHDEILPLDHDHLMAHADARLRGDAQSCNDGVR
jgi:hypothetical protein